jgi:hypothetical protein
VATAIGLELRVESEIDERVLGGSGDDIDGSAVAAVAAIRSAARDVLFAPEAQAAIAPRAGDDVDVDFVYEQSSGLRDRDDADLAPVLTVILEAHLAVDLRKEGVILSQADVEARLEPASLLANEDRSAGDQIPIVAFHAQALCVAVAAVA